MLEQVKKSSIILNCKKKNKHGRVKHYFLDKQMKKPHNKKTDVPRLFSGRE
jgi:hypothetical protein